MAKKQKTRYRSTFSFEGNRYEITGKNQKEADQKAAIKLEKLKRGEFNISGNMTVAQWADEWLTTYKKLSVGEGQYKSYSHYVKDVITPAIGSLKLKNVKDVHLQKILNNRAGYSKSDLTQLRITIKAIFLKAFKAKPPLISQNPAEDLTIPMAVSGTHRSITDYEREKILKLAETHNAGLWIKTLLYAGLRPGETRALDWRHIDFKKEIIHVEFAMKAGTKEIGPPKSEAGVRDIPIHEDLLPALLAARKGPFEPVFVQATTGKRHTKTSMRCLWDNFKNELDILMGARFEKRESKDGKMRSTKILSVVAADLVPYCLRHTYCTDLQDAEVSINVARYLMGHADISTTAKIYTHTTEKVLQEVAVKINAKKAK